MPYNPYQPFINPYQQSNFGQPFPSPVPNPYAQQPQSQQGQPTFAFVSGVNSAKSYPLQIGQSAVLMDTENSACYIKSVNGMGQATIEYYRLVKSNENEIAMQKNQIQTDSFASKDDVKAILERLDKLEKRGLSNE